MEDESPPALAAVAQFHTSRVDQAKAQQAGQAPGASPVAARVAAAAESGKQLEETARRCRAERGDAWLVSFLPELQSL